MASMVNKSGGVLILPDDTRIAPGEAGEVSDKAVKSSGVAGWIKSGALVAEKPSRKQD